MRGSVWVAVIAVLGFGSVAGAAPKLGASKLVVSKLSGLDGRPRALLAAKRLTVVTFARPDQKFSLQSLRELDVLAKKLAKKPVAFVALISDRHAVAKVQAAFRAAKVQMIVLRDHKEILQAKLAIKVNPTVVLVDRQARVVGRQVFRKVNFATNVEARIRRALGEISEAELQAVLHPAKSVKRSHDAVVAGRYLRMGRMLRSAGSLDAALGAAQKASKLDPKLVAAHVLVGEILQAQKKCATAKGAFRRALALDPKNTRARLGAEACP